MKNKDKIFDPIELSVELTKFQEEFPKDPNFTVIPIYNNIERPPLICHQTLNWEIDEDDREELFNKKNKRKKRRNEMSSIKQPNIDEILLISIIFMSLFIFIFPWISNEKEGILEDFWNIIPLIIVIFMIIGTIVIFIFSVSHKKSIKKNYQKYYQKMKVLETTTSFDMEEFDMEEEKEEYYISIELDDLNKKIETITKDILEYEEEITHLRKKKVDLNLKRQELMKMINKDKKEEKMTENNKNSMICPVCGTENNIYHDEFNKIIKCKQCNNFYNGEIK